MVTYYPKVVWLGDGASELKSRDIVVFSIFPCGIGGSEDPLDLGYFKPCHLQIDALNLKELQLLGQELEIPRRILGQAIVENDKGSLLDFG